MLQVICFVSVCLLGVWADTNANETQQSTTFNQTQEHGDFSGNYEWTGVRAFPPENAVETRIIGGVEAWAHSWPWQICLRFTSMAACGGAIIRPLWVISAAHCFKRHNKPSIWTVLAGKHDLDSSQENGQQVVGVSRIIIHNAYSPVTKENDIALLKLQQPLVFNEFVRPIDIWMNPLPVSSKCTITGWGSTRENGPRVSRLQEVNVTILPYDVCAKYYVGRMRLSMFCAGRNEGGVDACQGDSGGPLSCFTGSRYKLAGLVSWGVGCGRVKKPGVYTKMQQHVQWIHKALNESENPLAVDSTAKEDRCGEPQRSNCVKVPGVAGFSVSQDGKVSVLNVTESCPFSWPWKVSLQYNGYHYCSGTLISEHFVITAQHCHVVAKEDTVVLGLHDLQSSPQIIPIDKVFKLPLEHSFPPKNDVSLLYLRRPARLGKHVYPVCVPDEDEDEELDDSWICVTTGWGATKATVAVNPNRLHQAQLTLVNQTTCTEAWVHEISDSHICTHPSGATSCLGDFGAPLFCRKHGAYFLFGVVTRGSRHCDVNKPAIFTRVASYYEWITKVMGDI